MKKSTRNSLGILVALIALLVLSEFVFKRFDMTQDKRYTLTETTHTILQKIDKPLKINVLLGGELSGDYRTLKNEIAFILDEFRHINPKISYQFLELQMHSGLKKFICVKLQLYPQIRKSIKLRSEQPKL